MKWAPTKKKFQSFRNIATCHPSRDIFDDIISHPKHYSKLQAQENATSAIDHKKIKYQRVFQYGDTGLSLYVFEKLNWKRGRFSHGMNYGVWYGALEEETSRLEILYHLRQQDRELFANPKMTDAYIVHQRAMIRAQCQASTLVDLRRKKENRSELIGNHYAFCHALAQQAVIEGIDAFLTYSARAKGGTCTPIFKPAVIIKDEFIYYFDFIVYRNLTVEYKKSEMTKMQLPEDW